MSNYYDKNICCPKCGHWPILAMDDVPREHQYTYRCEWCGHKSQEYNSFPSAVDLLDKQVKELREAALRLVRAVTAYRVSHTYETAEELFKALESDPAYEAEQKRLWSVVEAELLVWQELDLSIAALDAAGEKKG